MDLQEFISTHRQEIIRRARGKVAGRTAPLATTHELAKGVPLFLTQLGEILQGETDPGSGVEAKRGATLTEGRDLGLSAAEHGSEMLEQGFTIGQVVHDYGDICQAVTELALELMLPLGTDDLRILNRCLDNAIASAVTEYSRLRDVTSLGVENERHGALAQELRHRLGTATLAFQAVKSGHVGVSGNTFAVLEQSLRGLQDIVDHSESEVRLSSGIHGKERLRVAEFIEEMEVTGAADAIQHGLQFSVERVDGKLMIVVDRHLFTCAVSNLLQNAFNFTRVYGHVRLGIRSNADCVSIEIEDECGGLQPGDAERMFRPFGQRKTDPPPVGRVGLGASRRAIEADGGKILLRDLPGKGCVFIVEMPLAPEISVAG